MKTGILSMQMVDNYGSLLQAYGLKKIVESLGSDVGFIDIKKIQADYMLLGDVIEYHDGESDKKTRFQKLFSKDFFVRLANKKVNQRFVEECRRFRTKYLEIDKKSQNYDLCIIGADEVFNCLNSGWWGYTSQLFGNVSEANTIITYAASCGATKYDNLPLGVKESIRNSFGKISDFSVRDANTYDFVSRFEKNNVIQNLDPVLIYDYEHEVENANLLDLPNHYCVIYSYSYRYYKEEEISSILAFCKAHTLTPVAIQGGQTWCKNFIACNPFECLKIFQNADFVITDTFHGAIFSIKYAQKFAVITRNSNYNKLTDLVSKINIEKHLINNIRQLEEVFNIEKDERTINLIINEERKKTYQYLRKYVNGESK